MQKHILTFCSVFLLLSLLFAGCSRKDEFPTGDSREELLKNTELPTATPTPSPAPKTTVFRDYMGWELKDAAADLEALNLDLMVTIETLRDPAAVSVIMLSNPNVVIGQSPLPGETLHEGDEVTLFLWEPEPTPSAAAEPIDPKGYSAEEIISYFHETVMHSEYYEGDEPELLRKWEIPILRFLPGDEYVKYALERIGDENTDGYATGWYSGFAYFEGEVGICSDIDRETKNSVILEEIVQCMGIFNDSYTYPDSLFYQGFNTPQWPTDMDWLMVQLLYREELKPGMNEEEVTAVLRGLLEE